MSSKAIFVQPGGGYEKVVVGSSEVRAAGARERAVLAAPQFSFVVEGFSAAHLRERSSDHDDRAGNTRAHCHC